MEARDKSEHSSPAIGGASSPEESVRLLVIGCGNLLAGDDGAGVEILRRLEEKGDCGCELRAVPGAGVELLECFEEADVILLLDAVLSGAAPGTLHLLPLPWPGIEPRALSSLSSHGWGLAETLALQDALGGRAPGVMLLGVEVEAALPGACRSPAVEAAIDFAVKNFSSLRSLVMGVNSVGWRFPMRFLPASESAGNLVAPRLLGGSSCV